MNLVYHTTVNLFGVDDTISTYWNSVGAVWRQRWNGVAAVWELYGGCIVRTWERFGP